MSALVLRRLPNGRWLLVLAPDAQRLETKRGAAPGPAARVLREDLETPGRVPFLAPLPAAGGRA